MSSFGDIVQVFLYSAQVCPSIAVADISWVVSSDACSGERRVSAHRVARESRRAYTTPLAGRISRRIEYNINLTLHEKSVPICNLSFAPISLLEMLLRCSIAAGIHPDFQFAQSLIDVLRWCPVDVFQKLTHS